MKKSILLFISVFSLQLLYAQDYEYKFRLTLKDKGMTSYSADRPEDFLAAKAIERRQRQGLKVDASDFPISEEYLKKIEQTGGIIVAKSKWLSTVSVHCSDSLMVDKLTALPFVSSAKFVWRGKTQEAKPIIKDSIPPYYFIVNDTIKNYYGLGWNNIKIHNGHKLHQAGYRGKGMDIAVIDAGFRNLPYIEFLDNVNVSEHKSFIADNGNLFDGSNEHGLNALSCIATNKPYRFIGTAPEATYRLLMSEDSRSEYPIEEDYWVAALEYADSVGVDVVNSSLGYYKFDAPSDSITYSMMDGNTMLSSRAAAKAVQKGMFLVCSAGNEGNDKWKKITSPADARGVLTVGAIRRDSIIAPFSSHGYTADVRVKPDVVAVGSYVPLVGGNGQLAMKAGTSFSSPIMCGLVACLWQAFPTLTNRDLLDVIQKSSDRYDNPDETYGYGIPDMEKAMQLAENIVKTKGKNRIGLSENFRIESDATGYLRIITLNKDIQGDIYVSLTRRAKGKTISEFQDSFSDNMIEIQLNNDEKQLYNLKIKNNELTEDFQVYF